MVRRKSGDFTNEGTGSLAKDKPVVQNKQGEVSVSSIRLRNP